jgi:heme oxygenase (mycobilin-producing)
VAKLNLYITAGTYEYLKALKEKHSSENMILMQNPENSLLLHETEGKSVFKEPRKYEIIDSSGTFENAGFAVLNHIPVTDEGRPVFEYRFKNRSRSIENQPGFAAIRVLRPLSSNTYIILTLWENEQGFERWQKSKAFEKAHEKKETDVGVDKQKIFSGPSYITKYVIPKEE